MRFCIILVAITALIAVPDSRHDAGEEAHAALAHEIGKLAAARAKISARQALETALKQAGAGRLAEIELDLKGEAVVFEFAFLSERGTTEIKVDALTGAVLGRDDEPASDAEIEQHRQTCMALDAATASLAHAVDAALLEVKDATVIGAEVALLKGALTYRVALVAGGAVKTATVDASGKALRVETAANSSAQAFIFETCEAGKPAPDFKYGFTHPEDGKASWLVTKDTSAPSGAQVLTLAAESSGATFNIALAQRASYQDVDVHVRVRANSGEGDQGGGVIWRCRDENNYYVCRFNPLESNFRVYKVLGGKRLLLASAECETETGKWHVVRARMVGSEIACWVDGKKLLEAKDEELKDSGRVGLWTKADASSSFDNLSAHKPRASASKPTVEDDNDRKRGG